MFLKDKFPICEGTRQLQGGDIIYDMMQKTEFCIDVNDPFNESG